MRVGIDLRIVHYAKAGFFSYARGLIRSLGRYPADTEFYLLQHPDDHSFAPLPPGLARIPAAVPLFSETEEENLRREVEPLRLDAIHFPFSLFPARVAARVLLTVHDLTCLHFPQFVEDRYRPYYERSLERATEADRILAVSASVAVELESAGLPPGKILACYPLTPFEDSTEPEGLLDDHLLERLRGRAFLLSVGSLEPRKNHLATLEIFARLRQDLGDVLLVLAGGHGWLTEPLKDAVDRHPDREDVWLVRDANDRTVRELMARCGLFLNLSTYEGFCLPVLEALAEGACVLSTPVPSLTESGFPEGGFVQSADVVSVATRVANLLQDSAARRDLAGRSHSAVSAFYRAQDPARHAKTYRL